MQAIVFMTAKDLAPDGKIHRVEAEKKEINRAKWRRANEAKRNSGDRPNNASES